MHPLVRFKQYLPVVTTLATLGVVLAAAVTAAGMHYALGWNWGSAIVFGVLIAATDPVSVLQCSKRPGSRLKVHLRHQHILVWVG